MALKKVCSISKVKYLLKKILIKSLRKLPQHPLLIGPAKGSIYESDLTNILFCEHGIKFQKVLPAEVNPRHTEWEYDHPFTPIFEPDSDYAYNERGIFLLENGSTIAESGWIITKKGYLMHDLTHHFWGSSHPSPVLNAFKICHTTLKYSKLCSFQLPAANNYFHWMMDVLPRIALFNKSHLTCDLFFVTDQLPFQHETLEKLGIVEEKRLQPKKGIAVMATELIVPSLLHVSGKVSKFACDTIRSLFASDLKGANSKKRLYIRRGNAKNTRFIENESSLIKFLTTQNFEVVVMDNLSVSQQARLFNSADIIISAHGAALTNLVFCSTGTSVIELFGNSYANPCYWEICAHIGINYIPIVESQAEATLSLQEQRNFSVNPDSIRRALIQLDRLI